MDRETRALHARKSASINEGINVGKPSVGELVEGVPEIWYITNVGLRFVVRFRDKIYYGALSTSP